MPHSEPYGYSDSRPDPHSYPGADPDAYARSYADTNSDAMHDYLLT